MDPLLICFNKLLTSLINSVVDIFDEKLFFTAKNLFEKLFEKNKGGG